MSSMELDPATTTPSERATATTAVRRIVSREALGEWEPGEDRPDPVEILVEERPSPGCPSWCRCVTAAWRCRRSRSSAGRARVMAADLAPGADTGLRVQLCGDAHLSNFGAFATPERRLIFDLNDFDETRPARWSGT